MNHLTSTLIWHKADNPPITEQPMVVWCDDQWDTAQYINGQWFLAHSDCLLDVDYWADVSFPEIEKEPDYDGVSVMEQYRS